MYTPEAFRITDVETVLRVMRENAFATVVSVVDGLPLATHVPLMVVGRDGAIVLQGHLAKSNPHGEHLANGPALVIFQGPHAYISPSMYVTEGEVPTWNYVAVHAYGTPRIIEEPTEVATKLREVIDEFDPNLADTNPASVAPDLFEKKRRGITMFEIPIDRYDAKAKMNQNKKPEDRQAVRTTLLTTGQTELAHWIPE